MRRFTCRSRGGMLSDWNPCSVGKRAATIYLQAAWGYSVGILVLLERTLRRRWLGRMRNGRDWDPCSVGWVVATLQHRRERERDVVGILVLLEGSLRPYSFCAGIALTPRRHPRFSGAFPRTSSAHPISSLASIIKISFGTSRAQAGGSLAPLSPVLGINPCSVQNGWTSIVSTPTPPAGKSCSVGPPQGARGCGTGSPRSGR